MVVGAGTSADTEASSDHENPMELDDPSSLVATLDGVPVSVRFSSNWEVETAPDATIFGVALAARGARDGEEVPGVTYSRSRFALEPMARRADGATNFDSPRA